MAQPLRNLVGLNGRLAPHLARTMMGSPRLADAAARFARHVEARGFAFTDDWASANFPFSAPLIGAFAESRETVAYLEIGAYEGRHLAFVDWLIGGKTQATVVDPWFDPALNPEGKYREVEPRFWGNAQRLAFASLEVVKGFSTYELPEMLAQGRRFDLIYVDGSHAALTVWIDLALSAALLNLGGVMVIDDYWHEESEIGGPGVKPAADRFHNAFKDYFAVEALYRQLALRKTREIPR